MGGNVNWKPLAAVGAILVGFTFTDLSPKGPWNDATFTSGSIGLIGLTMRYMAWFRFKSVSYSHLTLPTTAYV